MEYDGYEILVHDDWVVLGDDPSAEPVKGYVAQIRQRDPELAADGDAVWDFPSDGASVRLTGTTEAEVIEKAKVAIDAIGKRPHNQVGRA